MNKKFGLILLLLGIAIMVVVLIDPTGLGTTPKAAPTSMTGPFGNWPPMRLAVMAAGALLAVLGAYGLSKKAPEKK